ncbi:hypothetical protein CUZ95_0809 [Enterococcus lactis]|nr:hypothetical protein [Enterococcus lactis]
MNFSHNLINKKTLATSSILVANVFAFYIKYPINKEAILK